MQLVVGPVNQIRLNKILTILLSAPRGQETLATHRNKDDNIHKKKSKKIMNGHQEKITIKQCHTININFGKIGKSSKLLKSRNFIIMKT